MEGYSSGGGKDLSLEEIAVISEAARRLGIRYFKITGGEPLVRPDIVEVVKTMYERGGSPYISITTNGSLLEQYAHKLAEYVKHVNVSLHALSRSAFKQVTGVDALDSVLRGLYAARDAGLTLKINVVVLKGLNDSQLEDYIELAAKLNARLQLIELHPVGSGSIVFDRYHLPATQVLEMLKRRAKSLRIRYGLHARPVLVLDNGVEVEVVGPVGNYVFCSACTRMRITYDGKIIPCLNWRGQPIDLRSAINSARSWDEKVEAAIRAIVEANRLRRPNYMWPLDGLATATRRGRIMRLGHPRRDGRLVFTGPRARDLELKLVREWNPLEESTP
jgi:cyclic pyranopterin phosphate synthase